ncbi:MAG: signal peptidase I [Hymenobacter sp.]
MISSSTNWPTLRRKVRESAFAVSGSERGDIIVFRYPLNLKENYVKRVIGVPGDRIRFENKELVLNGRKVAEPYRLLFRSSSLII